VAADQRPIEQEAVRTTIVGGRPPGSGKPLGPIPRGIEVLVKKAAVDPEFRRLLLETRGEAAKAIGLVLDPSEAMILAVVPAAQLEAIIAQTTVSASIVPAFLGRAAAVMLAALGVGFAVAAGEQPAAAATDQPAAKQPAERSEKQASKAQAPVTKEEAAAIQARITKEYIAAFTDLCVKHGVAAKAIRISVTLGVSGAVESLQIQNPADAGPVGFRDQLSGQIMKWSFPDIHRASTLVLLMETPKEVPLVGDQPVRYPMEVAGRRADRPPEPVVVEPGRVTVFPAVVAVTKDEAAAIQAAIAKDSMAGVVELANKTGDGGKTVRLALTLDGKGGVESVQFLKGSLDSSQAFRDGLTGLALKWQFPDVKTAGAVSVSVSTAKEAAPVSRGPMVPIGGVMAEPPPPPPIIKPGRVTAVPGIEETPAAEEAAPPTPAPAPAPAAPDIPRLLKTGAGNLVLEGGSVPALAPEEKPKAAEKPAPAETKPPEQKAEKAKPGETPVSKEDAAAIQERIVKEYRGAFTDLAAKHGLANRTVRVFLWLDAAGSVTSLQFNNPTEAGPVGFRDQLSGQVMKWKFPGLHAAGTATAALETPKEVPSPAGEAPQRTTLYAVNGLQAITPPAPPVVAPGNVTVVPGIVAAPPSDSPPPPPTPPESPQPLQFHGGIIAGVMIMKD
jgi:hypothetical protein